MVVMGEERATRLAESKLRPSRYSKLDWTGNMEVVISIAG